MNFTSPVVVKLKANPNIGEGILFGGETYMDIAKEADGTIKRDANGQPMLEKRRDCFVFWPGDKSEIFTHQMHELEPVEVIAARTLEEMKEEVFNDVMDALEAEDAEEGEGGAEQGEPE